MGSRTTDNAFQHCRECSQTFQIGNAPPTSSRSEPDQLRMTLGELKPYKINENEGSGLQLACCAPSLTTPGRAFRKVRGSLGGSSHKHGLDQQISMKIHRISTKYDRSSSGAASEPWRSATALQFYRENPPGQYVAVLVAWGRCL